MTYSIKIKRSAAKEIQAIDRPERIRLIQAIDALAENPYRGSALKGDLRGLRRVRCGSYRVIYEIDEGTVVVMVVKVAHRREAYR